MHLDKPQLIFRGRKSVENRFQIHAWRDKPLKCLLVTRDLRLTRELTNGIDAHLNVAAANYPSLSSLERSLPLGADLIVMDNQAYRDYTRLASHDLQNRIGQAPIILVNTEDAEVAPTAWLTIASRAAGPQALRQALLTIHQAQEAQLATQRQALLH